MAIEYLIDSILPKHEVHLIAGPSGAGKTTWALQTLALDWQHSREVLGFKSNPVPWLYLSLDRSMQSIHATLERMKIPSSEILAASGVDSDIPTTERVLTLVSLLKPRPEFLYIDGFLNLLPQGIGQNDNQGIARWLPRLTRICAQENLTILGCLHSAKTKEGEGYDNPRQRVSGGAAWAGFADTIILVEPIAPNDPQQEHHRRLMVLPRNHKAISRSLIFNEQGRLVEADAQLGDDLFYAYLNGMAPGKVFTTEEVWGLVGSTLSRRNLFNKLERAVEDGLIEKIRHGTYKRLAPLWLGDNAIIPPPS